MTGEKKVHRSFINKIFLYLAIWGLFQTYSYVSNKERDVDLTKIGQEVQRTFGTVQNPTYSIIASFNPEEELRRYEDLSEVIYKEKLKKIKERLGGFKDLEKLVIVSNQKRKEFLGKLKENLDPSIIIGQLEYLQEILDNISIKSSFLSKQTSPDIESLLLGLDNKTRINKKLNEEELSRIIFKDLTGKNFPSHIPVGKEEIKKEGARDYQSLLKGKIAYEDLGYVENLTTLLHEYGHLCAQHQEEVIRKIITEKAFKSNDVRTLEEACAYAFTDAGSYKIYEKDKSLGKLLKAGLEVQLFNLVQTFYESDCKEWDEHFTGAELFIATRDTLKDPRKVFNYLAQFKDSNLKNLEGGGDTKSVELKIKESIKFQRSKWQIYGNEVKAIEIIEERLRKEQESSKKVNDKYKNSLENYINSLEKKRDDNK